MPEVETCEYTGCCTDNLPFYNRGFVRLQSYLVVSVLLRIKRDVSWCLMPRIVDMQPASRFFEACGALDDPKYHTPEVRSTRLMIGVSVVS